MDMKKKIGVAALGAALVLGVAAVLVCGRGSGAKEPSGTPDRQEVSAKAGAKADAKRKASPKPSRAARPKPPKPVIPKIEVEDEDDTRTPAERALAERIEKALDEEKLEDAVACAKQALICKNVEVRQAMVETLGWFGEKALPELTPFLADPDEDVRDSAMNEWSMAVSEIEDEAEKLGVVELAMNVLSDEDALEDISGEYIGVDEKLAVESLVRVIEANGSRTGVEKAKETYEFVTGDEWTSSAAAAKWIAEEYEPPEPAQK